MAGEAAIATVITTAIWLSFALFKITFSVSGDEQNAKIGYYKGTEAHRETCVSVFLIEVFVALAHQRQLL